MLIEVRGAPGRTTGQLRIASRLFDCAVGRSGIVATKREGDGGTPAGRFPMREVLYRPDRGPAPATALQVRALTPQDGWCDDPASADYNRHIRLPHPCRHEALWREDPAYDLIAVVGYNDDPPTPGAGSAIFVHLAREAPDGFAPTEGCVALRRADLEAVLAGCGPGAMIDIRLI